MKKITIFFLTLMYSAEAITQQVQASMDSTVLMLSNSLKSVESISYSAVMRTKKFKSEEFKEKRFDIFARRNANNKGYNFDWEIVEYKGDNEQRYIFIGKEFFYINKMAKVIGYSNNIARLSFGDYFEAMRRSTLFDEIIYDFNLIYPEPKLTLINESVNGNDVQITVEIDSIEKRILTIDKHNLLPKSAKNIVRYEGLNLTQIIETRLSNININGSFPDSVLIPQFYLNQDYVVKYQEQEHNIANDADSSQVLSNNDISLLFETTMVSDKGDTVRLDKIAGKLFLIDFWYLSCIPCLKSIPHLQELSEKYKDKGLKVIGINCFDSGNKENVVMKLKEKGITYENYFAERDLVKRLNINGFPTFIMMDKDKNVKFLGVGIGIDIAKLVEEEINKLK